ncbi:MAG: hypothetical protein J6M44_13970 [Butyrivibrio sp.]|nr:hypothetical protein [Butyrivibrio sp.]
MNRRDKKLDALCGELVDVTFSDGDEKTGVLEFGMQLEGWPTNDRYTLYVFGQGYIILRKTHMKKINLHK